MEKEELLKAMKELSNNFERRLKLKEVGEYFNVSFDTIQYYVQKYNLKDHDYWYQMPKNYITLFDKNTNLSSYWLGYLQADGCVDDKRLILECATADRILLEEFCRDTKICPDRICDRHRLTAEGKPDIFCSRLDIARSKFSTFPAISRRKSWLNESLPKNIKFWPWFEGLFHGDGCFGASKGGHQISVLVRDPMCTEIMEILKKELPSPTSIWKLEQKDTKGLFNLVIGTGIHSKSLELNNHLFIHKKWREAVSKSYLPRKEEKIIQSLLRYFDISSL